jgi:hypothetical protein
MIATPLYVSRALIGGPSHERSLRICGTIYALYKYMPGMPYIS